MDGHFKYILKNIKRRPFFYNIIIRSLKYWILIYFPLFILYFFLFLQKYKHIGKIEYSHNIFINILDSLLISPLIETSVMAILYITCENMSFKSKYRKLIFIFTVTLIAFFSHVAVVGSLFPAIGFFCQSIFFVRTIINYKCSLISAMIGTALIHVLHNIPYVLNLLYSFI